MPKKDGVLGDALRKVTAAPTTVPRRGRKSITVYLDDAAHRQLHLLALEQDRLRAPNTPNPA